MAAPNPRFGTFVLLAILGGPTLAAAQPPEFQVLHRFAEIPNSVAPALVEGNDGALYGVASAGGDFGRGQSFDLIGILTAR